MEQKSYRMQYEVHCKLQNFFGKEMVVKNCQSELHAKIKLNSFCKKHYGTEFDYIIIKTVTSIFPENFMNNDIFNDIFKNNKNFDKGFSNIFDNLLNKNKK